MTSPKELPPSAAGCPGSSSPTVVTHNGVMSVHNATYRSLPPSFSPPPPHSPVASPPQSPTDSQPPLTPAPPVATSGGPFAFANHGNPISSGSSSSQPTSPFEHYSSPRGLPVVGTCVSPSRGLEATFSGAGSPLGDLKTTELKKQQVSTVLRLFWVQVHKVVASHCKDDYLAF